ncbi:MAG: glycerol-3-phosphate O-acyltransferase [Cocleimonas sp.]|jgi:glycerol-3-phosphate O-acyltransferase
MNLLNYLGRKILYLWVKTEATPMDIEKLGINPELPLIYVLETRSWTNLLVLEHQCEKLGLPAPMATIDIPQLNDWHSVYTIAPRQPFKAWLEQQPKRSRMLRGIVENLRDIPEQEIQFLPVQIFWGRPVAMQKSWIHVLFADSWALAGRTRMLFRTIFHGRSNLVQYSDLIVYRCTDFTEQRDDEIIDSLQETLAARLKNIRGATLGPDVSHRRTLVRDLILKPAVQNAIARRSQEDGITNIKASMQASRYLHEIVANCTNVTIQVMTRALSSFWNRFYSGIEVHNNDDLKTIALTHELVYVPCHRSHIDYLLLSYVIFFQGLAIPYIAAGKNLNMPIIGTILRGGGAFFIRRSFKGNELYSTVMFEYVAELISKGIAIEYFVEGGRSRTGRLLQAKPGMLSMTVRGFLKYRKRPVAFIPVYIGYEKLLESKAYQAELSGEDKKSETFINSIRSILKIRGEYGKVHTNFGEPIYLNQLLDKSHPEWAAETYDDEIRPPWVRDIIGSLSQNIMSNINQAATVNAINLIATVLLASNKQSMAEKDLMDMLELYRDMILAQNYSQKIVMTQRSGIEQIQHAETLKLLQRQSHELGDILFLGNKLAISMTYYRNNTLHLLALPSLIACCFFNVRSLERSEIYNLVGLAYPFVQKELFLIWDKKTQLNRAIDNALDFLQKNALLVWDESTDSYARQAPSSKAFTKLTLLAKVISPILEVYYLTLALLSRSSQNEESKRVAKEELQKKCFLMAQRIAIIHDLNSPDYSDKNLIANFIDTLIHMDYLTVYDSDIEYSDVFEKTDKRIRLLLPKNMRTNILQMIND